MLPDAMERALAKIRDTARTVAEETGVSTLYLAFGFLEWFESDSSDRVITSPLLLLRVDIERKIVRSRYHYSLGSVGDEAQVNLTLSKRLDRDFKIQLPELGEDEEPERYLARVQEDVCKGHARWRVRRYVTLAHFPFARLAMFNDLDESLWDSVGGLAGHPLIGELLGGGESCASMVAEEYDVDAPDVAAKVPLLVLEADASQYSAVYDVMSGKNLVIEGPPGTGKSQTITNIIAAALANRRRVLFVADKLAALQVVKDRLDKVGLGDFCLELHSGKARKKDVIDALKARLERQPITMELSSLDERLSELSSMRQALTRYAEILNTQLGPFGTTVHDILWTDLHRRDGEGEEARRLDTLLVAGCECLTGSEIKQRKAALDRFELAAQPILAAYGSPARHPWSGVTRSDLPSVDFQRVVQDTSDVALAMERVDRAGSELWTVGIEAAPAIKDLQRVVGAIANLPIQPDVPAALFRGFSAPDARRVAEDWLRTCEAYERVRAELQNENIASDGSDGAEAASTLETHWEALAAIAPEGLSIAGLVAWAEELRADAAQLLNFTVAEVAELFSLAPFSSLGDIAVALRAVHLAGNADACVIPFITPELASLESREVIRTAIADISALKSRHDALSAEFRIAVAPWPDELRNHASALREAGVFGFLDGAAKAARRTYEELCKSPDKLTRQEMAAALTSIAEHLEAVDAVEGNQEYRYVFGSQYRGLATNTDAASAVADWAARVRSELAGTGEIGHRAMQTLLAGNRDRLRIIADLHGRSELASLRAFINKTPNRSTSLVALASELGARAIAIKALQEACERCGVSGTTRFAVLPNLCRLLRLASSAALAARIPESLAATLGESAPPVLGEKAPLRAALALAEAVASMPVSDELKLTLHGARPEYLREVLVPAAHAAREGIDQALLGWRTLQEWLGLDEGTFLHSALLELPPKAVAERLRLAAASPGQLGGWIAYLIERKGAQDLGSGEFLSMWDERAVACQLSEAFDRALHRALARHAFAQHPELDRFTGLGQDGIRARFKALDGEVTELSRRKLASELATRPVPLGNGVGKRSEYTDRALIRLETSKQKRHIPIRQLLDRAGDAAQALKPCFMMSPLSVSQFLKPTGLRFDLLVIDEASQMRPEDALGAIARSEQIVVVGDPKQLPPTSFFAGFDEASGEEDFGEEQVDAESILDLAQAMFPPMRRLRWHYRSRHGSLIAFSNREFYDDDLIVFPSPAAAGPHRGVTRVKVDGRYKARSNLAEVDAVCEAAVEHMRQHPERSLGIATMNHVQRDLIAQKMDQLAAVHPEVEEYRQHWSQTLERFFVKNLENVQGDERDDIYVSTVFGPSEPGGKVKQIFGPINGAAGHRRLNVLFTRAKHHVRLFTSMTPDDVLAGRDSPRGAQVLKRYLAYAADGRLDAGQETGRDPGSDFEVFVRDRLRCAGYEAVAQVGVSGYFIDLAINHPDVPGTFLLGVECDGASYHSTKSARDRDILRQKVLESLGWIIYRIWSTDWFRDPMGQTKKLVAFIEDLRRQQRGQRGFCDTAALHGG
jgi:very-short-patch-repair endonuclease